MNSDVYAEASVPAPKPQSGEVTLALNENDGKPSLEAVMPLVYEELCKIASFHLRRERREHTLQTSGLVHEAFLRLSKKRQWRFDDRAQFFGFVSQVMRRVLVDYARKRRCSKRGGDYLRISLEEVWHIPAGRAAHFTQLDDALSRLSELDAELATVVEMHFFGGFTHEEIADALGMSVSNVRRRWRSARAWLLHQVRSDQSTGEEKQVVEL